MIISLGECREEIRIFVMTRDSGIMGLEVSICLTWQEKVRWQMHQNDKNNGVDGANRLGQDCFEPNISEEVNAYLNWSVHKYLCVLELQMQYFTHTHTYIYIYKWKYTEKKKLKAFRGGFYL